MADTGPSGDAGLAKGLQKARNQLFETEVVWFPNVIGMLFLHCVAVSALFYTQLWSIRLVGWVYFSGLLGNLSITAGAHRLWSHRAYKARLPLRVFLMLLNCTVGQNDIYVWSRDHRLHHKHTETDADPHTTTRGMFFAHMGWLLVRKHPEVMEKGKTLDCSDILNDPVVSFQRKYYIPLSLVGVFILPGWFFMTTCGLPLHFALRVAFLRYTLSLHITWCINSVAHWIGHKPYDKKSKATENVFMKFLTIGEGYHNYHHVFPFDYKAAELPFTFANLTTYFIQLMSIMGQAYDLKEASPEIVKKRKERAGGGNIY